LENLAEGLSFSQPKPYISPRPTIQTLKLMQIHLNLPPDLMATEFDLKMLLTSRLFAEGLITSGQGAHMIGISRRAFIELLGQYGVSAFQTDENELLDDIANA
jgi:predicted HTH domain antitoxin